MTQARPGRIPPIGKMLQLYRWVSPALCQAAEQGACFSPKLAAGLAGRRGLMPRLKEAGPRLQGCVWFHVTSVGEYEQARPIIAALRGRDPSVPIAVTHFSPSGFEFALKRPCADLHDYLPLDHPILMDELVRAWRPRLLAFVKFDCWPNQVLAAQRSGVPVVLLAGSLQPGSSRLHPLARPLFRDVFDRFAHLGVCTGEDRDRFVKGMGVSCPVTVSAWACEEARVKTLPVAMIGSNQGKKSGLVRGSSAG